MYVGYITIVYWIQDSLFGHYSSMRMSMNVWGIREKLTNLKAAYPVHCMFDLKAKSEYEITQDSALKRGVLIKSFTMFPT
jgi:hypothetical protein